MAALYTLVGRTVLAGLRTLSVDLRSIGHENIPRDAPAVLASNHVSYLDFAFVSLAPPAPRREVRFLARSEFFRFAPLGMLLRNCGTIPVDVHGDPMQAAETARRALQAGDLIGIHPEGTISPSFVPRRAKSGAVRLAERAGVPIIPVAVWGSQRLLTKGRPPRPSRNVTVIVRYGPPFHPEGRTAMARSADLMDHIQALLDEVQAAYPQRPGPAPHDWWQPAHLGGSAPTPDAAEEALRTQDAQRRARRQGRGVA